MISKRREDRTRRPAPAETVAEPERERTPALGDHPVLDLQQLAGNQATVAAIGGLKVGADNDPLEREADRAADAAVATLPARSLSSDGSGAARRSAVGAV